MLTYRTRGLSNIRRLLTGFALVTITVASVGVMGPRVAQAAPPPECAVNPALLNNKKSTWVFVANFDTAAPLNACVIVADDVGAISYNPVKCEANAGVSFAAGWAKFDGTSAVVCPFDLNPHFKALEKESMLNTFLVTARTQGLLHSAPNGNPIFRHPSAAFSTPVNNINGLSLVTRHAANVYTSQVGSSSIIAPGNTLDHRSKQNYTKIYHSVAGKPIGTLPAGPFAFSNQPTKIYIGHNPDANTYLVGGIDQLIIDPRAGKGG